MKINNQCNIQTLTRKDAETSKAQSYPKEENN